MVAVEHREQAFNWILEQLKAGHYALPIQAKAFSADDWAFILEGIPSDHRHIYWECITETDKSKVLAAMRSDARNQLTGLLTNEELSSLLTGSKTEEMVEIIDVLPKKVAKSLITNLSSKASASLIESMGFDEHQVGRYVNHDVYTVLESATVEELMTELKSQDLPAYTDIFLVVDDNNNYLGEITLNIILSAEPKITIDSLTKNQQQALNGNMELLAASNNIKNSGQTMLPVVDDDGKLLGRFSIRDALDVFQQHYESQLSHMGKVSDEDLFAPVFTSAKRRAVWLGINLLTAFMASIVIGVFDQVVAQIVALAVLMPIVASMGGITGSQTLTLTIRGLATGQLASANIKALGNKEVQIAFLNGVLWAIVVAAIAGWWFNNLGLSLIIALALVINMLVAAISGITIPVVLNKLGIDPALAGSVILTTVTDVVGFFVFLGSAALLLV